MKENIVILFFKCGTPHFLVLSEQSSIVIKGFVILKN